MYFNLQRLTFKERFDLYMKHRDDVRSMLMERLKGMPVEEIAYLLAEHDKFGRIMCAEYEEDKSGINPLGVKVDVYGRPIEANRVERDGALLTISCGRNYDGLEISIS